MNHVPTVLKVEMSLKNELPDKPYRRSIRLQDYDYSQPGLYFVTICTKSKACFFGGIDNNSVVLSDIGLIGHSMWEQIPHQHSEVAIDEFVIMPNHIHGIIAISTMRESTAPNYLRESLVEASSPSAFSRPTPGSLSEIIRRYKARVRRWCNQNGFSHFQWQPRFYEHVIRNEDDLNDIRNYIVNNPLKWIEDEEYTA